MTEPTVPFVTRKNFRFEQGARFRLRVAWSTTVTGHFNVSGSTRDGTFTYRVQTDSLDSPNDQDFFLPDVPTWISVSDFGGIYAEGSLHVSVYLAINGEVVQLLCSGFIAFGQGITFPGGKITNAGITQGNLKRYIITDPGAGIEINQILDGPADIELLAIVFTFTTSATAATRTIAIKISGASFEMYRVISPTTQIASLAREYRVMPYSPAAALTGNGVIIIPLQEKLLVPESVKIETVTENLQAGDTFTNVRINVNEFINYNG